MNVFRASSALLAGALFSATAFAVAPPTCPSGGSATMGCNSTIIVNPDGSLTVGVGPSATPYDGSDDNLVGILNNTGHTLNSVTLSGTGNGGGIFNFDGDGIDFYIPGSNSQDTSDPGAYKYGGPLGYFSNISPDTTSGQVNFIGGLANGQSTYFSLESNIASTTITGGGGGGGSVTPEPSTFVLLGTGALGLASSLRRRFMQR